MPRRVSSTGAADRRSGAGIRPRARSSPPILPNEADTVVETVEAFLRQDYNQLQVILAYNTPADLPVEDELRAIAVRPAFVPMRVDWSTSKAQNVNAALTRVTGTFVAVFDADHHLAPGSFRRAWRWLSNGVDVVQGHCVVRNGADGFVQKLVASEFEAIYGVAHPGRAAGARIRDLRRVERLLANRDAEGDETAVVHAHRGHRLLDAGARGRRLIVSDPGLVSTELAPESWRALWGQRLRWAQGGRRCRGAISGRPSATTA